MESDEYEKQIVQLKYTIENMKIVFLIFECILRIGNRTIKKRQHFSERRKQSKSTEI